MDELDDILKLYRQPARTLAPKENDKQFRDFFTQKGFKVNRTFGKAINKGSLHPYGLAADIDFNGKSDDEIGDLVESALRKGYRVFDERVKQPGVKQTGPHLHFERNNGEKPSAFLNGRYGKRDLKYLTDLDNARLGKGIAPSKGETLDDIISLYTTPEVPAQTETLDDIIGLYAKPSPTNPVNPPKVNIPAPEAPETINAQIQSTLDPNSPKKGTLLTPGEQIPTLGGLQVIDVPEGKLAVNPAKGQPRSLADAIGKVQDVGSNTRGMTVLTTDAQGNELSASIVRDPKAAAEQVKLDKQMYPQAVNHELLPSDEVARRRNEQLARSLPSSLLLPNGQPETQESIRANQAYQDYLKQTGLPDSPESINEFNTVQNVISKQNAEANKANQFVLPSQRQGIKASKPQGNAQPKEITANVNWMQGTGKSARTFALDEAASQFSAQLGVDYDVVRQYLERKDNSGFTDEEAERRAKDRTQTTLAIDDAAISNIRALQAEADKIKRRKSYQEATFDDIVQRLTDEGELPSVAQLLAAKQIGRTEYDGLPIDEAIQRERDAFEGWKADNWKENPAEAYNAILQTEGARLAAGESPEALAQEYTQKQNARLTQMRDEVLAEDKSFVKHQEKKKRIADTYGENPFIGNNARPMARPSEFILNMGREILNLPGQASKALGIATDAMSPAGIPPDQNPFVQFGDYWEKRLNESQNKDLKDELIVGDVSKALAQLAEQTILIPFTGGASMMLPIGQGAIGQYDEARKKGATRNQRIWAATVGGLAAAPDAWLKFKFLKGLNPAAKADFLDTFVSDLTKGLAKQFPTTEARQMAIATAMEMVAKAPVGYFTEREQEYWEDVANRAAESKAPLGLAYAKNPKTWSEIVTSTQREKQGYEAAGIVGLIGAGGGALTSLSTSELENTNDVLEKSIERQEITIEEAQGIQKKAQAELAKRGSKITLKPLNETKAPTPQKPAPVDTKALAKDTPVESKAEPKSVESLLKYYEEAPTDLIPEAPLRPSEKGFEIVSETGAKATTPVGQLKEQRDEERRKGNTDKLTGLANQNAWETAKERVESDPEQEVISIDVNRMKDVNDTTSHEGVNKTVLKPIGDAVQKVLEKHGIDSRNGFRTGGDEFTIAVPKGKAQQVRDDIEKAFGVVNVTAEKDFTNTRTGESFKKGDVIPVTISGSFGNTVKEAEVELGKRKEESKKANPVTKVLPEQSIGEDIEKRLRDAGYNVTLTRANTTNTRYVSVQREGQDPIKIRISDHEKGNLRSYPLDIRVGEDVSNIADRVKEYIESDSQRTREFQEKQNRGRQWIEYRNKMRKLGKKVPNAMPDNWNPEDADGQGLVDRESVATHNVPTPLESDQSPIGKDKIKEAPAKVKPSQKVTTKEEGGNIPSPKTSAKQRMAEQADEATLKRHQTVSDVPVLPKSQQVSPKAEPTAKEAKESVKDEKVNPRTGLTKTQTEYLAKELRDLAIDALKKNIGHDDAGFEQMLLHWKPDGMPESVFGRSGIEMEESIKVPGDGSFKVNSVEAANRLHQKITGQPIEGLGRASKATVPSFRPQFAPSTAASNDQEMLALRLYGTPERAIAFLTEQREQLSEKDDAKALKDLDGVIEGLKEMQGETISYSGEPLTTVGKEAKATADKEIQKVREGAEDRAKSAYQEIVDSLTLDIATIRKQFKEEIPKTRKNQIDLSHAGANQYRSGLASIKRQIISRENTFPRYRSKFNDQIDTILANVRQGMHNAIGYNPEVRKLKLSDTPTIEEIRSKAQEQLATLRDRRDKADFRQSLPFSKRIEVLSRANDILTADSPTSLEMPSYLPVNARTDYEDAITDYFEGTLTDPIFVSNTNRILTKLKMPSLPILVTPKVLDKAIQGKHSDEGITADTLLKMRGDIDQPLAVLKSNNEDAPEGSLLLVLPTKTIKDTYLTVAIHPNQKIGRVEVNRIATIHARDLSKSVRSWQHQKLFRYVGGGLSRELTTTYGSNFAPVVQSILDSDPNIITESNDVNTLEMPSPKEWHKDIITDKGINYDKVNRIAEQVISGESQIVRLDDKGERGRVLGGIRNVEASIILAANERASEDAGSRTPPVKRQEQVLERYAKLADIWFDVKEFVGQQQGFISKGVEAYVHRADEHSVHKLIDYKMVDRHLTPLEFIDNRISTFNSLFPETAYELVGFTRDGEGNFRFVVKQPFIQDVVYTTPVERQTFMQNKGLSMTDRYGEAFADSRYKVSDLHEKNALIDKDGNIYVIDAVPKPKYDVEEMSVESASLEMPAPDEYQGQHAPPGPDDAPLYDVTKGGEIYPDDFYGPNGLRYYGTGGDIADRESYAVIRRTHNRPNAMVKIYRAVPYVGSTEERIASLERQKASYLRRGKQPSDSTFDTGSLWYNWASDEIERLKSLPPEDAQAPPKINSGDWVTLSRTYAKDHGESRLRGDYKIVSKTVPAKTLFTNGDSLNEFGYWESHGNNISLEMPAPAFFSQVERTIEQKMPNKASADQIKGLLKDAKKEELEWLDIDTFLKDNPNPTKQEVLDYVRANNAVVEEVTKEAVQTIAPKVVKQWGNAAEGFEGFLYKSELGEEAKILKYEDGRAVLTYDGGKKTFPSFDEAYEALKRTDRFNQKYLGDDTKFSQYALPGGENYRELLLTMPDDSARGANYRVPSGHGYGDDKSDKNRLAHVRFDERDGGKTLHVAEIQSDWHQAGRKKGYAKPNDYEVPLVAVLSDNTGYYEVSTEDGRFVTNVTRSDGGTSEESAIAEARRRLRESPMQTARIDEIPNAPFKTSWPLMAFKRVLRYAVENGYERVTFDTGETNAERYDLSKQVESIDAERVSDDVTFVDIVPRDNQRIYLEIENGRVRNDDAPQALIGKPLEDIVGKELAEQIASLEIETPTQFKGNDLKVGGEGMKAFYDRILPSEINKYVKKWGGRVEAGKVGAAPVHSLTITPAMKDAVMAGQTLFMPADSGSFKLQGDAQYAHPQDLLDRAKSSITDDGHIELNVEAGELLRRIAGKSNLFFALTHKKGTLIQLARKIDRKLDEFRKVGYSDAEIKVLSDLADQLREIAKSGAGVTYIFDFALPHETHHQMVLNALGDNVFPEESVDELSKLDVWKNPKVKQPTGQVSTFNKLYPNARGVTKAFEIAAMLDTGEIQSKDKERFLQLFAQGIRQASPDINEANFARIFQYDSTPSNARGDTETGSERQEDRSTGENDKGKLTQEEANQEAGTRPGDGQVQRPDSGTEVSVESKVVRQLADYDRLFKKRKYAETLRENGYEDTPDVPYIPDTEKKWLEDAQRRISASKHDDYRTAEKSFYEDNMEPQQRTALGIGLLDHLGSIGEIERMIKVSEELVKHVGTAAQALRASQLAGKYDFVTGMMIATRAVKKAGKELTAKDAEKVRELLTRIAQTEEEKASLTYLNQELETAVKEADKNIKELEGALNEAQAERKVDEKTIARLKRQIATLKENRPRTYHAKQKAELERAKPDLEKILREAFSLAMPSGESLEMPADDRIHNALVDMASLDILNYVSPEDTIEHLRDLTNNMLSEDELREIHLEAFEATKTESNITPEARKNSAVRMAHRRMAMQTAKPDVQKVRERPSRYDKEVITFGRDNGYTDKEILGAILFPKIKGAHSVNEWKKLVDGDDDTFKRSRELRQKVNNDIQDQIIKAKADREGYKGDLEKFKNEVIHNGISGREARKAFDAYARRLSRSLGRKAFDFASETVSLFKGLSAWGEISYIGRQGFIPLLTDTRAAIKGDWKGVGHGLQGDNKLWQYLADKGGFENAAEYLSNHSLSVFVEQIRQHPRFLSAQNNGVRFTHIGDFNVADDHFSTQLLEKVPFYRRAEVAYTLPGDLQRLYIYDNWATMLEQQNLSADEMKKALKYVAETVNAFTGKGDIGKVIAKGGALSKALNLALFSPQLLFSRFQSLNKLTLGWATAPKGLKIQMAKKGLRFYGILAVIAALTGMVLDPEDEDFGKINKGDTHLDILAGLDVPAQLYLRTAMGFVKSVINQDTAYLADDIQANIREFGVSKEGQPRFVRSKLSPGASLAVDAYTGTDFIGRPFTWWGGLTSRSVPLAWQQTYDALLYDRYREMVKEPRTFEYAIDKFNERERNYLNALMVMAGTFTGIGITQYPKADRSKAVQLAAQLSPFVSKKDAEQRRIEGGLRSLLADKFDLLKQGKDTRKVDMEIERWMRINPDLNKKFSAINTQAGSKTGLIALYAKDLPVEALKRVRSVSTDPGEIEIIDKRIKTLEK